MIDSITPGSIAAEIRMQRSADSELSFLILEGSTDVTFWKKYIDQTKCLARSANEKSNVIEVILALDNEGLVGALGIVDADFWNVENASVSSDNLLSTDTHDIETMVLASDALPRVLCEVGSESKINRHFGGDYEKIREAILTPCIYLGYLRWISLRQGLNLKFEGIKYSKFISKKNLHLDLDTMILTVKNHSQQHSLNQEDLLDSIRKLESEGNHDSWQICCGHDLINVLWIGLLRLLGTNNANEVNSETLSKMLRLAFERADLEKTKLYLGIQDWEGKTGFTVLSKL